MSDKISFCFKFDSKFDRDIIDVLNSRFNRTAFVRHVLREYLKEVESCQKTFGIKSPYYD